MTFHSILIFNQFDSSVEKVVDQLFENSQSCEYRVCHVQCSKKNDVTDVSWGDLENLKSMLGEIKCDNAETDLKRATNELHSLADKLPASGVILDIYLWPPSNPDGSDYILYLGALRRFKDWHNAKITLFDTNPNESTEFLLKFLSADINVHTDMFNMTDCRDILWRGKVTVCDKLENKGVTIPGVCMYKLDERSSHLEFPIQNMHSTNSQDHEQVGCKLGRMFEILDEISVHTIPVLFKTAQVYKLCLYQKHGYSQVFMNYIQQNTESGMLARLPVYSCHKDLTLCEDTSLSTELWKENITNDIQFVQEPEEDLLDDYEFLYFIITSPDKDKIHDNFVVYAHLLRHPYHINGSIVTSMFHQSLKSEKGDNLEETIDLSSLPYMNWETLKQVEEDILSLQKTLLQRLCDEKQTKNLPTVMNTEELMSFLADVRLNYLSKLKEKLQDSKPVQHKCRKFVKKEIYEVSENCEDWRERLVLQYLESQKRCLSRLQSSESIPMSSPFQPCEAPTVIDLNSFLKFFNPDGTAATAKMSPIRQRHPSRTKSKFSTPDINSTHLTVWPESKDLALHDIYYNVDRKSEKVNTHLNKLREKYVKNETYSSCLSSTVTFPRATKKRPVNDNIELRRSPRKKAPRSMFDENIPTSHKEQKKSSNIGGRLSELQLPLATASSNNDKSSHRRFSTPHAGSVSKKQDISSFSKDVSNRRTSDVNVRHSRTSSSRITDKSRRESIDKSRRESIDKSRRESIDINTSLTSVSGDCMKKESRSDRHKRRLQDIVDGVLESNGVNKTDPIYKSCSTRLFKVTKLFVMDLPNSRNLKDEMKKIAESQVKQVIDVDRSRQESKQI
ncbi:hypothetical protein ACF0H5_006608 [Mactra antiquata]